jgi:ABC-2 type transport system ATP-binding protein
MREHNILEVENISKAFGRRQVLDQVSFEAERGKITSIVGENGSGKTTLLKIIVGMLSADSGIVSKNGKIGFCPQDQLVFSSLTLRENLKYFATAYGLGGNRNFSWKRVVNEYVDEFELRSYLDTQVFKLSGGTRQKLNLVLALIHSPDMLILDEPYAAFDWESYLYFWKLVGKLKTRGVSFLVVSHLIYDRSYIDRIYKLEKGVLTCE